MRSELVFAARKTIFNRFTLCQAVAKGTRMFHLAHTPVQNTITVVLRRIASEQPGMLLVGSDPHCRRRTPPIYPKQEFVA